MISRGFSEGKGSFKGLASSHENDEVVARLAEADDVSVPQDLSLPIERVLEVNAIALEDRVEVVAELPGVTPVHIRLSYQRCTREN